VTPRLATCARRPRPGLGPNICVNRGHWGHRRICSKSYAKRHRGRPRADCGGAETPGFASALNPLSANDRSPYNLLAQCSYVRCREDTDVGVLSGIEIETEWHASPRRSTPFQSTCQSSARTAQFEPRAGLHLIDAYGPCLISLAWASRGSTDCVGTQITPRLVGTAASNPQPAS
jgi:hypothetical protein